MIPTRIPASGQSAPTITSATRARNWSALLESEERHVSAHGLGAGVIVVSFAAELTSRFDETERMIAESAIATIIERELDLAERSAVLAPGRVGVISHPFQNARELSARAHAIHESLRSRHLDIDVGYALRRDHGGLHAAAARADAALDTAIAARRAQQT